MENKVVWLFNHYAQEPEGSGGTRHFSLARHLKAFGWDMKIIAASVDHFTGCQRLSSAETDRHDVISDVSFIWLRVPESRGNGFARMVNMLMYSLRARFGSWQESMEKPDVIVGSSVHPFAAIAAAFLAKKYAVPFVFEVRDLWPETLVAMGRWHRNSWKTKTFCAIEKWLYRRAVKIVSLLPFAYEYIGSLGVDGTKVIWVSNGVDLEQVTEFQPAVPRDYFSLIYFGAHGQANGLDNLVDAMAIIKSDYLDSNIRLRLVGEGPSKAGLVEKASALQLDSVRFEQGVTKNQIPSLASEADALVICVRDLPDLYRYGISMNKLFDYMASGRPVVIASNARNNPVSDCDGGVAVEADNSRRLADAIVGLARLSREKRAELGANGRSYVRQHFDYKVLSSDFADTLNSAVAGP
ncbi:MAG TPA: glycosyltransferase WbuB [Alphaproteobacteria bacterium]|nr:glycosyltransferase WbuB [Alphaproteobacteria bacterium]